MRQTPTSRKDLRPHVRAEALPEDSVIVVRGGPDTAESLRRHARRANRQFSLDGAPFWGTSVFAALDDIGPASLVGLLVRMASYGSVHLPTVGTLCEAGFELLPTFARPHLTIVLASDDELELRRLLNALGPSHPNPYHESRPRPRR